MLEAWKISIVDLIEGGSAGKVVLKPDIDIRFSLPSDCKFEVFTGEAPGIPPTNLGVATADHSEKRPVQTCYPLIIRVRDRDLNVQATWNFSK